MDWLKQLKLLGLSLRTATFDPPTEWTPEKPQPEFLKDIQEGIQNYYIWEKETQERISQFLKKLKPFLNSIKINLPQDLIEQYQEDTNTLDILDWHIDDQPALKTLLSPTLLNSLKKVNLQGQLRLEAFKDQIKADVTKYNYSNMLRYVGYYHLEEIANIIYRRLHNTLPKLEKILKDPLK